MKNPTIATLLNLIPGLGYLYVGGKRKVFGVLLLLAMITSIVSSLDPSVMDYTAVESEFTVWMAVGLVSLLITVGAFMYDGYVAAVSYNESLKTKSKK